MKLKSILAATTLAIASISNASVTIGFDGGKVYGSNTSTPLPTGSLMYAIALPSSVFAEITTSDWISGDNIQIGAYWLTDDSVLGEPGGFSTALSFDLTGGVLAGQRFGMVWFPSATSQTGTPVGGSSYGFYSDPTWILPSDGSTTSFSFATVSAGGSIPDSAGVASYTVVPEPATWALLAGGLTALMVFRRRRTA